jgi:hypothetical protein
VVLSFFHIDSLFSIISDRVTRVRVNYYKEMQNLMTYECEVFTLHNNDENHPYLPILSFLKYDKKEDFNMHDINLLKEQFKYHSVILDNCFSDGSKTINKSTLMNFIKENAGEALDNFLTTQKDTIYTQYTFLESFKAKMLEFKQYILKVSVVKQFNKITTDYKEVESNPFFENLRKLLTHQKCDNNQDHGIDLLGEDIEQGE